MQQSLWDCFGSASVASPLATFQWGRCCCSHCLCFLSHMADDLLANSCDVSLETVLNALQQGVLWWLLSAACLAFDFLAAEGSTCSTSWLPSCCYCVVISPAGVTNCAGHAPGFGLRVESKPEAFVHCYACCLNSWLVVHQALQQQLTAALKSSCLIPSNECACPCRELRPA
jgi:hypothetical protein